ncbi:hypothetical protein ACHAPJ_003525 [Fusarium lateritium]
MTFYITSSIVSARLDTSPDDEYIFEIKSNRDWSPLTQVLRGENVDVPLFRTWDGYSSSQPDEISGAIRRGRRNQTIAVVDPAVRLEAGWPVVCFGKEIGHYVIKVPYRITDEELNNHYICLWRVMSNEIVGHWNWDDLSPNPNWYRDTILPAFRKFRKQRRRQELKKAGDDQVDVLSSAINSLGLDDDTLSSESPSSSSGRESMSQLLESRTLDL